MWWSDARWKAMGRAAPGQQVSRGGRIVLACTLAAAMVAGCADGSGFKPLYGSSGIGAGVDTKLSGVQVAPIPGRIGQRIRNDLIFETTGGGEITKEPVYRLEIAVTEGLVSTLVDSFGNPNSQLYTAEAKFSLIRVKDKAVVLKGTSFGRAAFERNPSVFANVRAQDDAQDRAARTIGTELKTRLAAYLATAS